jgi:uncharacterized membrane protein YhiD involved in acid resistance
MGEFFRHTFAGGAELTFDAAAQVVCRIALSVVTGFIVAGVYVLGLGRQRDDRSTLPTTLVLLTVVIAVVTQVIGESLARAFGLVGALSIVRFRTVVEDTRDTAFVIFAVVVGMAVGVGYSLLAAAGIPAVLVAALIMRAVATEPTNGNGWQVLTVRLGIGHQPDGLLASTFEKHLTVSQLISTATAKQGAALELTYQARLRNPGAEVALVADLNRIEGVQGVELKPV